MENLIVSGSPHFRRKATTTSIMADMLIALTPAVIAAVWWFGIKSLIIISTCMVSAVLSELLFNLICKKRMTIGDLSAAVTGLLLGLNLPADATVWHCIVGSVFAIVIVKCVFGGIGCNFANPAITARVMLLIAFGQIAGGVAPRGVELVGGATPLESLRLGQQVPELFDMLIGRRAGSIGETCAIALIIGFIYLVARKVISWHTPVIYVGTVFVLSLLIKQDLTVALYQVLGGGLLLGAIFMATDYSTTPINRGGKMLFALGCGIITVLIRFWGSYYEGVSFAILIMNIVSPYLEKLCTKKPFGGVENVKN